MASIARLVVQSTGATELNLAGSNGGGIGEFKFIDVVLPSVSKREHIFRPSESHGGSVSKRLYSESEMGVIVQLRRTTVDSFRTAVEAVKTKFALSNRAFEWQWDGETGSVRRLNTLPSDIEPPRFDYPLRFYIERKMIFPAWEIRFKVLPNADGWPIF